MVEVHVGGGGGGELSRKPTYYPSHLLYLRGLDGETWGGGGGGGGEYVCLLCLVSVLFH